MEAKPLVEKLDRSLRRRGANRKYNAGEAKIADGSLVGRGLIG
jgi:hypothetical protein